MKRKLTAGQTSVSLPIFIQDTSSTTGGGLSGLTSGTSGLVAEYRRRGQSSWTAITLTSKTLGTWTSGGIVADGALAGAYELDLPDAVCASGARWVAVRLRGAANMLPCLIEIELDAFDYQTATQPVNVTQFGGSAGTFASGRPDVNTTHVAGTAQTARDIGANVDATVSSRLASASYTAPDNAGITSAASAASSAASTASTINTKIGSPAATLAADIASVKTDTGTTIPGMFTTLTTKVRKFFQLIARKDTAIATDNATELSELNANGGSGAGAYSQATDSLEAIRDRGDAAWTTGSGGGGSGTGARTVTITVNDGTTALQNARVRLTEGANTFTAQTNASGVATFNVDDATYTVAITKAGYSYSGTTLAVSASTSVTYSMTAITITPSTGDQTTGYLTTLDETGQAEANVSIYVSLSDVPDDYGLALDEATRTVVSDEDGLVEITGMVKGATYNLRRGLKGRLYPVTIPTSAGSSYELPNIAGV